jgi:outer membrane protein assembly factor BamE
MKKVATLILCTLALSSCSLFQIQRHDIEQGNVITQQEVSKLKIGMSESQVKDIMGSPVVTNIFANNRMDYVYSYQPGHGNLTVTRMTCLFANGRLRDIQRG